MFQLGSQQTSKNITRLKNLRTSDEVVYKVDFLTAIKLFTFVIASVFWNVTAPGTILVVLSRCPLVAVVAAPL